jgi:hypothetical protein
MSIVSNFYNFENFFIFISDSKQVEDALSSEPKLGVNGLHFPFLFLPFWAKMDFSHL